MTGTVHWLSLHFVAGSSNKLQPNASGLNFSELTYAVQKTTLLHYIKTVVMAPAVAGH